MSIGVSASDFIALPQFAWKVYKECRDSAPEFIQLAGEVQAMHAVLNELAMQHKGRRLNDESKIRLATIQKGCQEVLKSVEDKLLKYKSLGTEKKRLRDRMRWTLQRERIVMNCPKVPKALSCPLQGFQETILKASPPPWVLLNVPMSSPALPVITVITFANYRVVEDLLAASLDLQLGVPYSQVNDSVSGAVPEAIHAFQRTFPDRYGFRVRLISEALRHEASDPDNAPVIAAAQKFLVLSLVISHNLMITNLPARTCETVAEYLHSEIGLTLSILLEDSLRQLLGLLQTLISRQCRADWPVISLALSLLFLGVESMQVDIYLQSRHPRLVCESMEETAILMLADIFTASTRGFKPLTLDWDVEENVNLVEGNSNVVETLRGLQRLSQEY
ncbi:MAG: hypothetical protein Q9190_003453, partial [Brigantiaea leucoxantha]